MAEVEEEEETTTETLGGKATVVRITKEEPAPGDLTAISLRQLAKIIDSGLSFAKLVPASESTVRDG